MRPLSATWIFRKKVLNILLNNKSKTQELINFYPTYLQLYLQMQLLFYLIIQSAEIPSDNYFTFLTPAMTIISHKILCKKGWSLSKIYFIPCVVPPSPKSWKRTFYTLREALKNRIILWPCHNFIDPTPPNYDI